MPRFVLIGSFFPGQHAQMAGGFTLSDVLNMLRSQGLPFCPDRNAARSLSIEMVHVTARGARVNGSRRCDCRDQGYKEDNTARNGCSDQSHASGRLAWAEGKLSLAPLGASCRGRKDPRCGNAIGLT